MEEIPKSISRIIGEWIDREIIRLSRESVVYRVFRHIPVIRNLNIDQVGILRQMPLGMFFYNQRAIFLTLSGVYCLVFWFLPVEPTAGPWHEDRLFLARLTVSLACVIASVFTLAWHPSFVGSLGKLEMPSLSDEMPRKLLRYFWVDFVVLYATVTVSYFFDLGLIALAAILILNLVIHGAYIGRYYRSLRLLWTALAVILIVIHFWHPPVISTLQPVWVNAYVSIPPLAGALVFAVFAVSVISLLRLTETVAVKMRLEMLDSVRLKLNMTIEEYGTTESKVASLRPQFDATLNKILKDLCSSGDLFWASSACLWYELSHKDQMRVLIPGPRYNFAVNSDARHGVCVEKDDQERLTEGFYVSWDSALKRNPEAGPLLGDRVDGPVVAVPLTYDQRRIGLLILCGTKDGPPIRAHDMDFARALAFSITEALIQGIGFATVSAMREMDRLYELADWDDVFVRAAGIMKKYLGAESCMILFRTPGSTVFDVKAKPGFKKLPDSLEYGQGTMTLECANGKDPKRIDDVSLHRDEFDTEKLDLLQGALKGRKQRIRSWMAIPVGFGKDNYGVIIVVNRQHLGGWFVSTDVDLGRSLALRLHVIIKRHNQLRELSNAAVMAEKQATREEKLREEAERLARERQEQLMNLTHQLVAPLTGLSAGFSFLNRLSSSEAVRVRHQRLYDLTEDALCLAVGTYVTFAKSSGQTMNFRPEKIDAPAEMKRLAQRMRRTNYRRSLEFIYRQDRDFPDIAMDHSVFTSVLYSLLDNAMKYADDYSEVTLESSYEEATGQAALKVKSIGEPILPDETELIFEMFGRGRAVREGRHHAGVGLGLWVARELIRTVGGNLRLEKDSNEPRFTAFIVTLPE